VEVVERLPVLDQDLLAESEVRPRFEETALRIGFEFPQHPRHREEHRRPLVDFPQRVDSHADPKDHEVALDSCGHAFGVDLRHTQ